MYHLDVYLTPVITNQQGEEIEICPSFNGDQQHLETKFDCFYFDNFTSYVEATKCFDNTQEDKECFTASNLDKSQVPNLANEIIYDPEYLTKLSKELGLSEQYIKAHLEFSVVGYFKDEDGEYITQF